MKIIKHISILVVALILFVACQDDGNPIGLCNDSDRDVYLVAHWCWSNSPCSHTGLSEKEFRSTLVKKGKCEQSLWFFNTNLNDMMHFFLFDADTFETYSWQELRDGNKILQRYDLKGKDIKRLNYTVPYPPTEAMRDIKMYPPYESE